jgi:hypothetical protein
MQPLKMSLTDFAKLLVEPKTRPLELNFFLSGLLHCTSHPLVRRMKTRAAVIAKI